MSSDMDAEFDAIVGGLDDLAAIGVDEAYGPETNAMDQLLDWRIDGDRIVVERAAENVILLASIITSGALASDDPASRFDVPDGDLRVEAMAGHADDLNTEVDRCITAATDFLTGGIPVAACFDAARGLQQVRLRILTAEVPPTELGEHLALVCAAFSEDLLALALA